MAAADIMPELDALDGWPAPAEQTAWYGASADERVLLDAYRGGRMHHAWLITGPRGSGKATLAHRFARFALAHPVPERAPAAESLAVDPSHPAARKIAAHAHPNLLTLARPYDDKNKRFKESVTVDEIRRTNAFFGSTAGEAGCCVPAWPWSASRTLTVAPSRSLSAPSTTTRSPALNPERTSTRSPLVTPRSILRTETVLSALTT